MNRSLINTGGSALIVSQFTLAAETRGNRPGFATAAAPDAGGASTSASRSLFRAMGWRWRRSLRGGDEGARSSMMGR